MVWVMMGVHSIPSMSGLTKVGSLLMRRAAFPLAKSTESFW